jgi:hypothetical protein
MPRFIVEKREVWTQMVEVDAPDAETAKQLVDQMNERLHADVGVQRRLSGGYPVATRSLSGHYPVKEDIWISMSPSTRYISRYTEAMRMEWRVRNPTWM